jgi:hypothetical protein
MGQYWQIMGPMMATWPDRCIAWQFNSSGNSKSGHNAQAHLDNNLPSNAAKPVRL